MADWSAVRTWSFDVLTETGSSCRSRPSSSTSGPTASHPTTSITRRSSRRTDPAYRRVPSASLPELADDIRVPPFIDRRRLFEANLWLGGGDNVTPLHFDLFDGALAVIEGSKRLPPSICRVVVTRCTRIRDREAATETGPATARRGARR